MTELRFEYEIVPSTVMESIFLAGKNMPVWTRIGLTAAHLLSILLTVAGGGALAFSIGVSVYGNAEQAMSIVPFGVIAGAVFHFFHTRWPYKIVAQKTASSLYGDRPQMAVFDQTGIVFGNELARWQTDWAAVENIERGKQTITLTVAAIAFMLPLSAVHDPEQVLAQLRAWKDNQ